MLEKWSDYTFDVCPYCGSNMGVFASTYTFNFCFVQCPHCGGQSQSAYVQDGSPTFEWIIPDEELNRIHVEAHKMVQEMMEG